MFLLFSKAAVFLSIPVVMATGGKNLQWHPVFCLFVCFFFGFILSVFVPLGLFTPPSGRGLVIPVFFLGGGGGHLPRTSSFCSAKQILVMSFTTQVRACFLSDCNIFCTLGEGQQRRGLMPLGLFLLLE